MKRISVILGVLLAMTFLLSASMLLAQEGRPRFDPNKMTGGAIKTIDAKAMTFEVERMNRQTGETTTDTIYCTDKTTYQKDGNEAKFSDFKEGDRIRAMGERKDGKFWADSVMSGGGRRPRGE